MPDRKENDGRPGRKTPERTAARERRSLILGEDGRHVWVGRATFPSEHEISEAETALAKQGLAGWLAVAEGLYWQQEAPLLLMEVRPLAQPQSSFDEAVAKFEQQRVRNRSG